MRPSPVFVLAVLALFEVVAPASAQNYENKFMQYKPDPEGLCIAPEIDAKVDEAQKRNAGIAIVVAWAAKLSIDALERAAQEQLKNHTAQYGNQPKYVLLDDASAWKEVSSLQANSKLARSTGGRKEEGGGVQMSCFQFKRIDSDEKPSLILIGRLWKDKQGLRVAAEKLNWDTLAARHSGGNAAVSISFTMDSLRNGPEGGNLWTSPERVIVSEERMLLKGKVGDDVELKDKQRDATESCAGPRKESGVMIDFTECAGQANYSEAALLPLPPRLSGDDGDSLVAFQVTVVEAGRPSFGLRAYAKFLSENKEDLSEALADALGKIH